MALIKCEECGNEVSDKAESCPKCGNPIVQQKSINNTGVNVQTIQETSKKFKKLILISWTLIIIGMIYSFSLANSEMNPDEISSVPFLMILIGVIMYIYSKFQIWWNHR